MAMQRSSMSGRAAFDPASAKVYSARGSFDVTSAHYKADITPIQSSRINAGNFVLSSAGNTPTITDSASFQQALLDRSIRGEGKRSTRQSLDRSGRNSGKNSRRQSFENDEVQTFDNIHGGGAGGGNAGNLSSRAGNMSGKTFGGGNVSGDRAEARNQRLSKGNMLNTPAKHTPGNTS